MSDVAYILQVLDFGSWGWLALMTRPDTTSTPKSCHTRKEEKAAKMFGLAQAQEIELQLTFLRCVGSMSGPLHAALQG